MGFPTALNFIRVRLFSEINKHDVVQSFATFNNMLFEVCSVFVNTNLNGWKVRSTYPYAYCIVPMHMWNVAI